MGFGDLKNKTGLKALDDYLADKSYIEGQEVIHIHYFSDWIFNSYPAGFVQLRKLMA